MSGEIPGELGNIANLRSLYLHDNELVGEIPRELGRLLKLEQLFLSQNRLTGETPSELGNLPELEALYLFGNHLDGEIPGELGNLSKLIELHLDENHLSGQIPMELGSTHRPGTVIPEWKHIEWGDTARTGQPIQFALSVPVWEPVGRMCTGQSASRIENPKFRFGRSPLLRMTRLLSRG